MSKPDTPNFPGMSAMTDSLDFVKTLWGSMGIPGMNMPSMNATGMKMPGMGIPGMVMPTLSVEEINKKIADLKAVENWLTLNMNMLRGTIQALEVQAATISTLQTMSESFTASMQPAAKAGAATSGHDQGNGRAASPAFSGNGSGNGSANGTGHAGNGAEASTGGAKTHGAPEPTSKDQSDAANLTAPLVNAAAWWNMLQDQFKQAVSTAMTEAPKPAESAPKTGAKASSKPKAEADSKEAGSAKPASAPRKPKAPK
ncbi:PhaM family polyhydroxyalkanoate granule multifunctional regulatory protein [Noviherbaspirillum malthae]|uniref:PhaM family polyhydroxyalkanoate granule multifunctional regulatory protein n=1 Tax=Noviherbaspirillum malthae TaxID=1260987 RepID=UPI0018901840|nr:PhaM family polyhydroxyalkanoate granule multifunctional regulatory protein [Noviherbaspirillum malthae]